jgi:hypothetical protein
MANLIPADVADRCNRHLADYHKGDLMESAGFLVKCQAMYGVNQELAEAGCTGQFSTWLDDHQIPRSTAYNYVRVWSELGDRLNCPTVGQLDLKPRDLPIKPSALIKLSELDVPDKIRNWAFRQAEKGHVIDGRVIAEKVAKHREKETPRRESVKDEIVAETDPDLNCPTVGQLDPEPRVLPSETPPKDEKPDWKKLRSVLQQHIEYGMRANDDLLAIRPYSNGDQLTKLLSDAWTIVEGWK